METLSSSFKSPRHPLKKSSLSNNPKKIDMEKRVLQNNMHSGSLSSTKPAFTPVQTQSAFKTCSSLNGSSVKRNDGSLCGSKLKNLSRKQTQKSTNTAPTKKYIFHNVDIVISSEKKSKKCRKVFGVTNKHLWCSKCKWRKACTKFA